MIRTGDIYLADMNEEVRRRVLVVSTERFHRASDRALVAPERSVSPANVQFPWWIRVDDMVFAVDLVRTIPLAFLLERLDRAPMAAMEAVRRAVHNIT